MPDWKAYYANIQGREPRPLVQKALTYFDNSGQALDLGCGNGIETAYLLSQGWRVLAIDAEPTAIELVSKIDNDRLQTQHAVFTDMQLIVADLIHASYSLPFCPPQHFDSMWANITAHIKTGGYFAGEFFGDNDEWVENPIAELTFHSEAQVRDRFAGFEIVYFHERDEDGRVANGTPKHWHVFTVIARKG